MPIPPVLRPLSPSSARLWSIDDTIGFTHLPSVNARTETSGPVKNSSTTTLLPLSPKILSSIISLTPDSACSSVSGMITPLPSARPSALMTVGNSFLSLIYAITSAGSEKTLYSAVGILYLSIRFFEKTFEPSIIAAFAFGPNVAKPSLLSASTIPITSGSSGATTTKSALIFFASATTPSISVAPTSKHSAS